MAIRHPFQNAVTWERAIAGRIVLGSPVAALFVIWGVHWAQPLLRDRVEISGVVTLNGNPLPGAIVTLHPCGAVAASGNLPQGEAAATGEFQLQVPVVGESEPRPQYIATVASQSIVIDGQTIARGSVALPSRYERPETSPLKFELSPRTRFFSIQLVAHDHGQIVSGAGVNETAKSP